MLKISKYFCIFVLLIVVSFGYCASCFANSAEPPSILIIVPNAPDDLEIGIASGNQYSKASKTEKIIENYYTFYSRDLTMSDVYTLQITTGGSTTELLLNEPLKSYNNIFSLDLQNRTLTPGKSLTRSVVLVSLRVFLTLILEAFIFFLFGYREKKSWIAFLFINLLTQGVLNIWINAFMPLTSYIILTLVLGEIMVFVIEIILFLTFVKEHRRLRTVSYVIVANLLSLFAGGFLITVLPI